MSENVGQKNRLVFRINDHGQGPELLRQVFLERGWIEFDEDDQEEHEWNLWWRTSRFRNCDYDQINPWQRLNHYPKSTGITKKDCLARNLKRMKGVHGAGVYNFSPIAFNLPNDYTRFVAEYSRLKQQHSESKHILWICKPADLSRGRGIFLFRDISELQYDCNAVVQQYISNPFLIGGYKFDIRVYVAVPSFHPLNIYIFEEGLVRFGTEKFDLNALHNVFAHLTNTSINKHSPGYALDKERVGPGCKWTITQLRQYFHQHNVNDSTLWTRISNIIILTLLVQAPQVPKCDNCFELYGFDILIDENLKPWLLEVNFSPALSFDCQADLLVKKPLLHDLLKLLDFKEKDMERGGDAYKKLFRRGRTIEPYDRHSSMSRASQRGSTLKKTTSFHKNMSSLNKQQTAVQESAYFINEVPESKRDENMCFGLPLATPGDEGRPSSASSGISSVDSDKLEILEEGSLMERQRTMGLMSERSATACSRRLFSRDGGTKPEEYQEFNNNNVKGSSARSAIIPVHTMMERSATMSSVVRRADYQQGSQTLTEKGSTKSSYTSDSGVSSYSSSSHENSDLITKPESRRNNKLLPQRLQTNNLLHQQVDQEQVTQRGEGSPLFDQRNNVYNIKSLQPNETSSTLRKIAASGMTNSQQQYRNGGIRNGARDINLRRNSMYQTRSAIRYPTPRSSRESPAHRYSNAQDNNNAVIGSRTQLYVSTSPVPRRLTRNAERQIAPPLRKSQNSQLGMSTNRHRVNSNGPKTKGPCSRVGDMFLVFPFSDVTLRTANSTLDPHVVIKETQRLLRESIHSVDKGSQGQKLSGHLPYGQPLDADRLWGPIKQLPEETA
ncbi:tubulin polyglutamylase TTLL7-like [Ylistrum balloti]|uniref:tubulin polyglutamylase TTLL7-like n=1 Tax=Ylistrum balloti TaxID=509963 RepID=UPI002905CE2A|nr:tubulin polyglutamylase TTLL7-like [Ylistrum balloti]